MCRPSGDHAGALSLSPSVRRFVLAPRAAAPVANSHSDVAPSFFATSYDVTGAHAHVPSGESVGEPTRRIAHRASTVSGGRLRAAARGIGEPLALKSGTRDSNRGGRAVRASPIPTMTAMNYRRLGRSGLKVSELSFGSWVTYGKPARRGRRARVHGAAYDAGVNFFDNAEVYAKANPRR